MTERLAYTAYLKVEVFIETDHGVNNPIQGYEPPYDYPVIRNVEHLDTVRGPEYKTARHLISTDGADDFDPDGLLVQEARSAGTIWYLGEEGYWLS